ncbi:MAG: hypothetical protein HS115_14990 [Spirochaetales bacterium]|nr:hypothetical protein [Spirochaetales bacterium]
MAVAVLENEAIRQAALPITVEQYHKLYEAGIVEEQVELIEGVIIQKIPKSPRHTGVLLALCGILPESSANRALPSFGTTPDSAGF